MKNKENVLDNLSYFMEWGGSPWENLCRHALKYLGDLRGKSILEVGPRFGKMSAMFALLGANVVGIETSAEALKIAKTEVKRWGVEENVFFAHYNGDLESCDALKEKQFDVIFSKSVLVVSGTTFSENLIKLEKKLKSGGKCVFLENRDGGPCFHLLRRLQRCMYRIPLSQYKHINYLTPRHLGIIEEIMPIIELRKTLFPPIYLIITKKKSNRHHVDIC